ncbi:MAG: addiction module protein [Ignavibacteriales bacterium]|nr:addiction module protein [Ignavibacteriales bacterium]
MDSESILKEALQLSPAERLRVIELLAKSLSKPDDKIDEIWGEEAEKRYKALKAGKVKTYLVNEIIARYK